MSSAPYDPQRDASSATPECSLRAGRRATVSAVLIVKNEARTIEACLDSLGWADEIIVLDGGSTDRTVELAVRRGAKVYVRTDWEGYGIQRQRAHSLATGDYIFSIDADERVTPELRRSIERVLAEPDDDKVYKVVMKERFLGKYLELRTWHRSTHVRLFARRRYQFNSNLVHESLDRRGAATVTLSGSLLHDSCHDYQYFQYKYVAYAHAWARQRAQRGQRSSIRKAIVHASWMFVRKYVLEGGFLDGRHGFVFAWDFSQYVFNKYVALWYYTDNPPLDESPILATKDRSPSTLPLNSSQNGPRDKAAA